MTLWRRLAPLPHFRVRPLPHFRRLPRPLRRRRARRERQRGFTLVELLVVLLILGLIAMFAVPQVIKYLGGAKTVTIKGLCTIHEDAETKKWFYADFSTHLNPGAEKRASAFQEMLDSPLRVVLEVVPEKFITYDGVKMAQHTAGKLDDSALAQPAEADTVRLKRELERRGLS